MESNCVNIRKKMSPLGELKQEFSSIKEMITYIDEYIADTPSISVLEMAIQNVNSTMNRLKKANGELDKELFNYRKKLYKKKKKN